MELGDLRRDIDAVDDRILELLAERRQLVERVVETKRDDGVPLRSTGRERELLERLSGAARAKGLEARFVTRLFQEILEDSLAVQQSALQRGRSQEAPAARRVVFQGGEGAYSQLAAEVFFGEAAGHLEGLSSFGEVVAAVEQGGATHGILPVENTAAGSVHQVYDLLLKTRTSIVGEVILRVDHCLLGVEQVPLESLRRVLSHWQALAQCSRFLSTLERAEAVPYEDTALAARRVREDGDPSQAAIASRRAADLYGLEVLRRDLADERENFTRFLVLAPRPVEVPLSLPARVSLVMATTHRPGALLAPLGVLERHGLNLTKLESRPRQGSPFEYLFYLDFEGNLGEPRVRQALDGLRRATSFVRILGCYPCGRRDRTEPSPRALAMAGRSATRQAEAPVSSGDAPPPGRLVDRTEALPRTVVRVGEVEIGSGEPVVIAGPCAVESEEQILACARQVRECGGRMLRGGCFKPRTSPYSFQGLGWEGLELLAVAGRRFGLPVVTEVLAPGDVERVAELADVLQIGARNMQNFSLLTEVGRVDRAVLLKRGMSASLDELLNAAEYILAAGNQRVVLCERGIRTFESATRNTLDLAAVALLRGLTHLPVIVDPSHAAGRRELVRPLAVAARAVGPDGLMVEIHPDPARALSDGPQALPFDEFEALMREVLGGAERPTAPERAGRRSAER